MMIDINQATADGEVYTARYTYNPGSALSNDVFNLNIAMPRGGNATALIVPQGWIEVMPALANDSVDQRFVQVSTGILVYENGSQLDGDFGSGSSNARATHPHFTESAGYALWPDDEALVGDVSGKHGVDLLRPRTDSLTTGSNSDFADDDGNSVRIAVEDGYTTIPLDESRSTTPPHFLSRYPISISKNTHAVNIHVRTLGSSVNDDTVRVNVGCVVIGRVPNLQGYRFPAFDMGPTPDWWQGAPN